MADSDKTTESDSEKKAGSSGSDPKPKPEAKKPAAKADAAKKSAPKKPANLQERMEGVQGWMAELEKKQERATRIGGVALGLAILAAAGALALGIMNKQDAATKDDIADLTTKVNDLGSSVEEQTESQLKSINDRLTTLEAQISSMNERQRKAETQISSLQKEVDQAVATANAADSAAADANATADAGADNP